MLTVYYGGQNGSEKACVIRPTPLISITQNAIRNKAGMLGSYYDIVLNGTIISDEGSPYYIIGGGSSHSSTQTPGGSFISTYNRPQGEAVSQGSAMASIIVKQNLLRELFKNDGQKIELLPVKVDDAVDNDGGGGADTPVLIFHPTVQSISFEEGLYVNTCKYTINLRAEVLLDSSKNIISDGLVNSTFTPRDNNGVPYRTNNGNRLPLALALAGSGFIEDYSETWSIEVEEGNGTTNTEPKPELPVPREHVSSIRSYKLSRNITATGRTMYYEEGGGLKRKEAWEQAKQYVYLSVLKDPTPNDSDDNSSGYEQFPEYTLGPYFGSGYLNIAKNIWGGYNHLRTESFDITAGTFTLNDTWLLSSGNAYENYRGSVSRASDSPLHKVSMEGTIKGLSSAHAGSPQYGGTIATIPSYGTSPLNTQYQNALYKWHKISNSGTYGPLCWLYKRAQSLVHLDLNYVPLSISLAANPFNGEITYNIEYDTRSQNIVSGTLSENITCNDTYPGDYFAVIPVIGRQNGPVLQYIGGRTEYQRSLNIDLVMDKYYASGLGSLKQRIRNYSVLSKPSLNEPFKSQISSIIDAYSPKNENGIRKYFISPPSESWDASSGKYTLQLNWTYELNR